MKLLSTLLIILVYSISLYSQGCIDYGEIDEPTCVCTPPGWDGFLGSEEIDQVSDWTGGACETNVDSESPSGGTFASFHIVAPGGEEGMETTITGLTPGAEYNLAFWWLSVEYECAGNLVICCSELEVTVDGETHYFEVGDGWELAEICFEAGSSSVDISVTGTYEGQQGHIFVDDVDCEELTPCCPLIVEMIDEYESCPQEDIQIIGNYSNETGDVTIEWESDPPDGIDYLSDLTIIDPIFNYDQLITDGEEIEYIFMVTIEDEACDFTEEIFITVNPNTLNTFDFDDIPYCERDGGLVLPLVSNEGTSGTWNIAEVDFSEFPGETIELVFTPDGSNDNCPLELETEIEVLEFMTPNFDFPLELCRTDEEFELPEMSLEGIDGYWNIDVIEFEDYSDGPIDLEFTPENLLCTEIIELTVELSTGEIPQFILPTSYCRSSDTIYLPDESEDNILGTWFPSFIDLTQDTGTYETVFETSEDLCLQELVYNYQILDEVEPGFILPSSICKELGPISFDSVSPQGYLGYWEPLIIDPDTVQSETITFRWYPIDNNDDCLQAQEYILSIAEASVLEADLVNSYCVSDAIFTLTDIFQDSISGTWDYEELDPSFWGVGSHVIQFLPDSNFCYQEYNYEFTIDDEQLTEFNLPETICESELPFLLPVTDDNNIAGSWNLPILDSGQALNQIIAISFTPDEGQGCYQSYSSEIVVQSEIAPEFSLAEFICWDSDVIELSLVSDNAISGSWNLPAINPSLAIDDNIELIFTPDLGQCAEIISYDVALIPEYELNISTTNPSSCTDENGFIEIMNNDPDFEYSIDGGVAWQMQNTFENLSAGNYQILVRNINTIECTEAYDLILESPGLPEIIISEIIQPNDCENIVGSISIETIPEEVSFSIDNGNNWTDDNLISDLPPGNYTIMVRANDAIDCINSLSFEIEDITPSVISELITSGLTDCEVEDGSIEIIAQGIALEYSIDGGMSWQQSNVFENLAAGEYDILIRSTQWLNCDDESQARIDSPVLPEISDVILENPNTCEPLTGSIQILPSISNYEYSIDGGNSWQASNTFEGLQAASYSVAIRDISYPMCIEQSEVEMALDNATIQVPDFETQSPSDCDIEDGTIRILGNNEMEYSIDGGTNWIQTDLFENLAPGTYTILVRDIEYIDCRGTLEVLIEETECDCEELVVDFETIDFYCTGGQGAIEITDILGVRTSLDSIIWTDGSNGERVEDLESGNIGFTIYYDSECTFSETVTLEFLDPLSFGLEVFDTDCTESENGSASIIELSGGQEPYAYSLNPEVFQNDNNFYNLSAGDYTAYIIDDNGCLVFEEFTIETRASILTELPAISPINSGEQVLLNPLIDEGSIDSFQWSPAEFVLNPGNLIANVSPTETTTFTLSIYYGDCIETRSVLVEVVQKTGFYIANIFDPNSLENNRFFVQGEDNGVEIESMRIYDRWGNMVFEKLNAEINNPDDGWDGYYNNQKVNPGVFVYMISYRLNGVPEQLGGNITVVR